MRLSSRTRGLAAIYGSSLMLSFGHGMYIPAIPALAASFEVSIGAAAQVVTAHALGRLVGTPVGGIVVDRVGTRVVLLAAPVAIAVAALSIVATPSFLLVLVAMFFAGAADSTWMMGREIAGLEYVRADQRGRLISGLMGVSSAGMALGPLLGGGLTELFDYRAVFVAYAVLAAGALPVGLTIKNSSAARAPATTVPGRSGAGLLSPLTSVRALGSLLRQIEPQLRPTFAVLVFATFSMMLYRITLHSMLPLYADAEIGLSPTQIGALFSIQGVVVFFWIMPAGFVLDKVGRKWSTVPSTAVPGIMFLLYPFADSFLQLAIISVVLGMLGGLSLGALATSTYDVIPANARGRLQAVRRTIAEVGGVLGPGLGGIIANAHGAGWVFIVYAPVILLSALLMGVVARETLVKHPAKVD
jgi:MFS family permease